MCFLSACCHPNGSVQLVPTVPMMALKALCAVEFSLDQLQNLVGHVCAWSQRAAWCILSVSIITLCRKSVSATHCFPPVLKSGHRRAFPFSAHRLAWKFGFVSIFPVKSDGAWRFKRSTVTLNTWAFKFDESNWKLHAYFTVTAYSVRPPV